MRILTDLNGKEGNDIRKRRERSQVMYENQQTFEFGWSKRYKKGWNRQEPRM